MPQWRRKVLAPDEFRRRISAYHRPTREMKLTPGDPGCYPVTKISGIPWWPAGLPRPKCSHDHFLSFMAQFLLSDIPGFESHTNSLLSFHYCQQCSYEGNMPWGWWCDNKTGYDVSVIDSIELKEPDGLGEVGEVVIDPQKVKFRDVTEFPGFADTCVLLNDSCPNDYPQGEDDFDENIYPGVRHIAKRKVGGWPSWVQHPEPPEIQDHEIVNFAGQLDWWLCDTATWCSGGYAYLFLIASKDEQLRGEMIIQTT